ncbi:N-terminal double-transmembrane domain-containing protein [Lysobacter sp. yr284]|uniref:BatA domain-containing protein n=1 Tax=Lysobacter sp. yr284 TaxID=1761791 RepID=UPI00089985B7|nr:BatA domain-containing protein [Lysobacter sp. yr284]SDY17310.1 N-terminal double-transmembrane domain-containing protein [Lysobacter sp. yr284]
MSAALLLPLALAALAALALPLLIHLARRSEQRPTVFAALRWLRERPRPRSRIRFDEWPLLALRLLLLAAVALLLARPVLYGAQPREGWLAVMPGLDPARAGAGLDNARLQRRWLAPGFPDVREPAPAPAANAASLLRELDARLPPGVAVTVAVPAQFDGADGARLRLSRPLQWRVVEGAVAAPAAAREAALAPPPIRYAPERAQAAAYLRAAVAAWDGHGANVDAAPAAQAFDPAAASLIWLVPGPVPATVRDWVAHGGRVLLDQQAAWPEAGFDAALWRDPQGRARAQGARVGRGQALRLTGAVEPRAWPALLQPGFATGLRELFADAPPAPARVAARDYAPAGGAAGFAPPPLDLRPWLALLVAALFLLERLLATRTRRGPAP